MLCMTMSAANICRAQSNLVINSKDGSKESIELTLKPTVTFGVYDNTVTVTYGEQTKTINLQDLQFDSVNPDSNELVILTFDDKKQVVLPLSSLLSIIQRRVDDPLLPQLIASDPSVSIFNEALERTGLADSLKHYVDVTYNVSADSTNWNNRTLVKRITAHFENVAYMPHRYYKFTALLVKDEVLSEKYGITDIDGLRQKAHEIYDVVYPEDRDIDDETDRRNALNRFISYHLLPFEGYYWNLTCVDQPSSTLSKNFMRKVQDITDWYETMMPNSIMKFSFPSGVSSGLYVNRRGIQSRPDEQGIKIRGAMIAPPSSVEINTHAINGIYHYIDDIVAYDQTMQQVVCNDRMRIDCTTLSPDFMTSGARGHYTKSSVELGKYGQMDSKGDITNTSTCLGFKSGSAKNVDFNDYNTSLHVSPRYLNFWNYQGDAVRLIGNYFNVSVKLPALPAGTYELRMGVNTGFAASGLIDIYIDDELKCDHLDIRPDRPYDPEGSPYDYIEERVYENGSYITHIIPRKKLVWLTDQVLEENEQKYYSDNAYAEYVAEYTEAFGEEYVAQHAAEIREEYESNAYYSYIKLLFPMRDNYNSYRTLHAKWEAAQNNPGQYVFEGNEPLDPNSEEMQAWYESTIDKTELLQLGYKAYYHKKLHEKGWMHGPASYSPSASESNTFADITSCPRKVIGTFNTDGKSDHFMRLQQVGNGIEYYLPIDYIELIPVDAIANEDKY